jgi:hypothetical protein
MIRENGNADKLGTYIASITTDAISLALHNLPTAVFGQALADGFSQFLKDRSETAKKILLEELSSGDRLASDVSPTAFYGLLFQYLNAVKLGAAKRNLRMMAEIIREGSIIPIPFQPDEVASCAKIVAVLTNEEIILLAELKKQRNHLLAIESDGDHARVGIHFATLAALVPKIFQTEADFLSVASALQRTGLVRLPSVWGGSRVDTTRKFDILYKLCESSLPK